MATKYYVRVNQPGRESDCEKWDMETTRKAEYTKYAKDELKKGAESVDVYASVKDQCTGTDDLSYIHSFYPEDFYL